MPAVCKKTLAWGWEGAGTSDGQPGDFHAVYALDNGAREPSPAPVLDGVITSLARYDFDANGHYVIDWARRALSLSRCRHARAPFLGRRGPGQHRRFRVERTQSQRLRAAIDPDLQHVSSEPQVFNHNGDGSMIVTINPHRWPRCWISRSPSRRPKPWRMALLPAVATC